MTPCFRTLRQGFVAGKQLLFEVLAKEKPALIQCDEQGWVIAADRLDESKKLI
jgi:hypothetical protein